MIYNKLVRDKMPEIIRQDENYLKKIDEKLDEELKEYHEEQKIEELADIIEVIYAAAVTRGYSVKKLEKVRQSKIEKHKAFNCKILLKEVK